MKKQAPGFIMMEVLVALVLVTSVGIAIVLWAENSLHSVARLHNEYERMRAVRLTQDWVRALPDTPDHKGEATLGAWKIIWAKRQLAENPQTGYPKGYGVHDALLLEYTYQVYLNPQDTQPWFSDSAIIVISRKMAGINNSSTKSPF